jgi:hypothetical protein
METYPNDADGDALRRVVSDGNDMSLPMLVDFSVALPDQTAAESFASVVAASGYEASVVFDKEDATWDCYCTKRMVLSYDGVIAAQSELDEQAGSFGGNCDGWGTFGNKDGG